MTFYEVKPQELVRDSKLKNSDSVKSDLIQFINSDKELARVEDEANFYNNNNDLRRAIQYCIEHYNMPIHVFMKYEKVYVQKE